MSLRINTNVEAMDTHRNLVGTESDLAQSMQRLSSGLRINSAADDVAGYAIVQGLTGQVNGLNQAQQNAQDGVSLTQTAQGALDNVAQMLQRIRELAVQYANGTNSSANKLAIQSEVNQLQSEIDRIGNTAQFNGVYLLKSASQTISFQVGANDGDIVAVATISLAATVGTISLASAHAISTIDKALQSVSAAAGAFGAVQNRMQYTLSNLATYSENLSSATSQIKDVDMASEMTNYTKDQILEQAGVAMLAQANQEPQAVLSLIKAG
jgi:flagellin